MGEYLKAMHFVYAKSTLRVIVGLITMRRKSNENPQNGVVAHVYTILLNIAFSVIPYLDQLNQKSTTLWSPTIKYKFINHTKTVHTQSSSRNGSFCSVFEII